MGRTLLSVAFDVDFEPVLSLSTRIDLEIDGQECPSHTLLNLWSELNSLLFAQGALCSHESETGRSHGGPLSHLWRQGGRKVRAQYWPASHRSAPKSAPGGSEKTSSTLTGYDRINNPILD